jgi:hypothetical protein
MIGSLKKIFYLNKTHRLGTSDRIKINSKQGINYYIRISSQSETYKKKILTKR